MKPEHIRMYTRVGCEDSSAARDFLREQGVHFEEVDIDQNSETLAFVMTVNEGNNGRPHSMSTGTHSTVITSTLGSLFANSDCKRTGSAPKGAGKG